MGFSNRELIVEGELERGSREIFHNKLYCEHVRYCKGMAERVKASPLIGLKFCYRNPGRKRCKHFIAFEEACLNQNL